MKDLGSRFQGPGLTVYRLHEVLNNLGFLVVRFRI